VSFPSQYYLLASIPDLILKPFYDIRRCETPALNLDEEIKRLVVTLSNESPQNQEELLIQIKKIVSGTHLAFLIQAPKVKKNIKGRPSAKKGCVTSTKRNPSAFELVKQKIKHQNTAKKRPSTAPKTKNTKRIKKIGGDDSETKGNNEEDKSNGSGAENKSQEEPTNEIIPTSQEKLTNKMIPTSTKSETNGGVTVSVEVIPLFFILIYSDR
jgi:hypothetical protein